MAYRAIVTAAAVILGFLFAKTDAQCVGTQNYRLAVTITWSKSTDRQIPNGAWVPQIIAVSHKDEWSLFQTTKPLAPYVKSFMQTKKLRPLFNQLDAYKRQGVVGEYDHVTRAYPKNIAHLNVKVNGGTGATFLSVMGLVSPTPDRFFGVQRINLCDGTKFVEKYPRQNRGVYAASYDGGWDARANISVKPIYVNKAVQVDSRRFLTHGTGYATFTLVQGTVGRPFPFWKILVIVGCAALVVLVAFICLYPRCCKRQMLDVPVPLQDESQWAT